MCIHFYRLLKSKLCVKSNITSMLMNKCKQSLWTSTIKFAKSSPNPMLIKPVRSQYSIQELARRYDKQILFSSTFEQQKVKLGYRRNKAAEAKAAIKRENAKTKLQTESPIPVTLKYLCEDQKSKDDDDAESNVINIESTKNVEPVVQFPFESFEKNENLDVRKPSTSKEYESIEQEVSERNKYHNDIQNWMTDYENFDDKTINWKANYGTPDPKTPVSSVACGGCGSLLHCKDSSIPGYLPSEIFKSHRLEGGQRLSTLICQRCHFLKHYDMALQVRVSPEDYPRILHTINENRNALVIVMVDLLDFPCSVWPDIINIIGRKKPVVVVGNKIDLLPQDSRGYLNRIQQILANNIGRSDLNEANIQHVALISAKTGYGVEELITKLHNIWKYRGDVYLVGCTNVGKSTLFNALLQSDYCKIKAGDLIQRATTSIWPGTTLNLLKFPILRPSGWRLFVRTKRLMSLNKLTSQENKIRKSQLMKTKNPKYATLMGHIERTFTSEEPEDDERKDIFSVQGRATASGKSRCGINENEPQYKLSKWCYDTPGVVQPDQILHLLTTEELMLTLPKQLIQPRTFNVKPGLTMFVAGLGRLDFIEGPLSIRFTVFASENLPVTICLTENADTLYSELIGTEILRVPMGNEDRLQKWPALESSDDIYLTGEDWETSCADIVLSSAGWIAVSLGSEQTCKLKAWTPEKRGIVVRNSILPKAVSLRGRRVRHSPAYKKTRYFSNEIK